MVLFYLELKLEEGLNSISNHIFGKSKKGIFAGVSFWVGKLGQIKTKKIEARVYLWQRKIANFIKKHRTVKFLHLLRKYAAMSVVVSNAFLVISMNFSAKNGSGSFWNGIWKENKTQGSLEKNKFDAVNQSDLALVPLAKASMAVDTNPNSGMEPVTPLDGQTMIANASPAMKDPEEEGGVKIYTVEDGDTLSSVAAKFKVTVNTILWANDIENADSIMPGDEIFILPVSGLSYIVKKDESLEDIARKYKADKDKIIAFNDLPANGNIEDGQEIIIPGGQKEAPQSSSGTIARREYTSPSSGSAISGWKKLEGKAGSGHKFPYGYCTWYVAQRRYVPWGGNAGTWLYHAKALGYKTGKIPAVGSIMVTTDSPYYGHVAIVEKMDGDSVTVSEMNYRAWGKSNQRVVPITSRKIKGYIY